MIDTAITADAEVRRLRQLGEATHDWCEVCPPTGRPSRPAGVDRSLCARWDTLRRAVSPRCLQGAVAPWRRRRLPGQSAMDLTTK